VLDKQPGGEDLLSIRLLENAKRGPLADGLGVVGIDLRDGSDAYLKG
jgi:hypothetical protein